jgi:pSer/pThr/pTyr-binding forkhead associated (FHA) protein
VIGRQSGSNIRIPSEEVSRRHCVLRIENGVLVVEDLQSVNGTYVNDRLVTRAVVRSGDQLRVGPATFLVEYERVSSAIPTRQPRVTRPVEPEPVAEVLDELPQAEILDDELVEAEILEEDLSPVAEVVEAVEDLPMAAILEDDGDANAAVLELAEDWELNPDQNRTV